MIILDTNVVSELIRQSPDPVVLAWFIEQDFQELFLTTVNEAELRYGAAKLPPGRRRDELTGEINNITDLFTGKILPFDSAAAYEYADIMEHRRAIGRPMERHEMDCQIAAITRCHRAEIATRNVADFTDCGIPVINPWHTGGAA